MSLTLAPAAAGYEHAGRRRGAAWVGIAVGAVTGVLLAHSPVLSVAAIAAAVVGAVLMLHVDLAAVTFIALAPFEGYTAALGVSSQKVLGTLLILSWVLHVLTRRPARRPRPPALYFAGVLFAALLASTVLHQNGALGTQVVTGYVAYLAAFVVLVDCLHDRLSPVRAARAYVIACSIAAVCGFVAFLYGRLRAGGPLEDSNDFAFYLLAALPLCLALRRCGRHGRLYDLAAVALVVGMLATLSRGALTGLLAMLVFAVATRRVRMRAVLASAAVVAALAVCLFLFHSSTVSQSLHAKSTVAAQNVDSRLIRWKVAAEMTFDHPLLGLGPGGFRANYNRYSDFRVTDTIASYVAHEMYLEVSSELGLIGLAAFLAVLGLGYAGAHARQGSTDVDGRIASAVCMALVGVCVAALFLTEQYYLPVWLLAAIGSALPTRRGLRGPAVQEGALGA
jgi:putative inorganic carbon (HCO3(-)) transporter